MPTQRANAVIDRIMTLVASQGLEQRTDAELAERFGRLRDELAFEALLKRHGPLILRLCRRLLRCEQDAEDVFQATFLVFARKASSLKKSASIGPWLYGVASRLAAKSRASSQRRREKDAKIPVVSSSDDVLASMSVLEAERILHEELAKMPAKFRDPLVLCHLEGKTRDEAARAVGCALGTLKDRLLRGKELLRARLARRGVGLPAALVASLMTEIVSHASASEALTRTVVQSATESAAAAGLSTHVATLVETGIRGLSISPAKLTACLVASTLLIGSVIGWTAFIPAAAQPVPTITPTAEDDKKPAKKTEPKEKRLDALGDPLPDGAVMRLGTRRHRVQHWRLGWQSLPDGKSYLTLYDNGSGEQVHRIDSKSGVVLEKWDVPNGFHTLGFSPDGRRILIRNNFVWFSGLGLQGQKEPEQECSLVLYDLTKRQKVWTYSKMLAQKDWIRASVNRFSADGKWFIASDRYDQQGFGFWDATAGIELWSHKTPENSFELLGFSDNQKFVVVRGNNDGRVYLFDRPSGKVVRSFPTMRGEDTRNCKLSPDGGFVLIAGFTSTLRVWNLAGKEQPALVGHGNRAQEMVFSPDGKTLFTGGHDSFVLERAWPSGKELRKIDLGREGVEAMAVSGDGKRLEATCWGEQTISFFDLETGKWLPSPIESHRGGVYGVATTPDGKLISFGSDGSVRTWDLKAGKATDRLAVERDMNAFGFALSRDGRLIAVPTEDVKGVSLLERLSGKLLRTIPAEPCSNRRLEFSPDGRWLTAIYSREGIAQVWATDTGKQVLKLKTPQVSYAAAGSFSADGRIFAYAEDGLVRFFDTTTWKEQPGLEKVFAPFGIAFSPDGRTIATAGVEGIRLYESITRRERLHLRPKGYPEGCLRYSPDSRFLAWNCEKTKIQVYDVWTGVLLEPFAGHDGDITGLTFTIDGKSVASSSWDSTILVWDVAGSAAKTALKPGEIDSAWQALAAGDAPAAFEAIRTLAANPDKAVKRIGERIKPAEPLDPEWLAARLRDLDSPKFAARDRATRDLEKLGERAALALEKFLAGKLSVDARERAERIAAKVRGAATASESQLQMVRSLEVLERIGSPSARQLVESLAKGADDAVLTREAKAMLGRWKK